MEKNDNNEKKPVIKEKLFSESNGPSQRDSEKSSANIKERANNKDRPDTTSDAEKRRPDKSNTK